MRSPRSTLAPLLALAACLSSGCGAERRPTPIAASSASSAASSAVPVEASSAPSTTAAAAPPGKPYDAARLTPRLDAPDLAAVKQLVVAKKWRDAIDLLDPIAAAASGPEKATLLYLSAIYRTRPGIGGAADRFDEAAKAGGPLASYASYRAALLRSDDEAVLAALAGVDPAHVPRAKTEPLRAKALVRSGRLDDGFDVYRAIVARHDKTWAATSLELARALLDHPASGGAVEAATLALDVSLDGAARFEGDAKKILDDAISTMAVAARKPFEDPSNEELAKRGARLVVSGKGKQALAIATKLEKKKDASCGSMALRARALAAVGRHSEASTTFDAAITACAGDASMDGAKLLWDAGRAAAKGGDQKKAIARFTSLEADHPTSSLCDDARIERARSARDDKDDAAFANALSTITTDYPKGDLSGDGAFLLAMELAGRGDWSQAMTPLEKGLALEAANGRERAYHRAGRFEYFLGRAYVATGDGARAATSFRAVLARYPLSYYAALACARADELAAGACKAALDDAKPGPDPEGPSDEIRATVPFVAAEILASLDDAETAMIALDALGVGERKAPAEVTLAAGLMLARTTHPALSHLVLRSASEYEPSVGRIEAYGYRDQPPLGAWRDVWSAAYPRPFAIVVSKAATESGVPEGVLYALMREESAFDPNAVSKAGALGLTQIMPATAKSGAKRLGLATDAPAFLDPEENVRIGAHFIKKMRDRFPDDAFLAIPAYNAGPLAPEGWAKDRKGMAFDLFVEDIPYSETRAYTKRVIGSLFAYEVLGGVADTGEGGHTPALARKE